MNTAHRFAPLLMAAAVLAAAAVAPTSAMASRLFTVKVINQSSYNVVAIRSAPTYRSRYGKTDLLGKWVLRTGYEVAVDFESGDAEDECMQDVVATSSAGGTWTRRMNVCTTTSWTLND